MFIESSDETKVRLFEESKFDKTQNLSQYFKSLEEEESKQLMSLYPESKNEVRIRKAVNEFVERYMN